MNFEQEYLEIKRKLFRKVYETKLNPEQCDAVFQVNEPVLILAGAGSGKTTVLVKRIAFLIRYGNAYHSNEINHEIKEDEVNALRKAYQTLSPSEIEEEILPIFIEKPVTPSSILAITFTNKAANEIKERLAKELQDDAISSQIVSGTFHSVCVRFLRQFGDKVGHSSNFTIYDTDDKKHVLQDIMKELNIDEKTLSLKFVANIISHAKDEMVLPTNLLKAMDPRSKSIQKIYEAYQKKLLDCNALDFDDIIAKTVELLTNFDDVRSYYNTIFQHVCIDEYQDTNKAQFKLAYLLSERRHNLMVVGDDDQSIYKFRGATIENILKFDKRYDNCSVIRLEQNYRSTQTILEAANSIIQNNHSRHEKSLWTEKGLGEKIHVRTEQDNLTEAQYIVDTILDVKIRDRCQYKDFAILYRVNEMSRSLESAFVKSGIPYRILGGQKFYDRKEIRDILAYLRVIYNSKDNLRLQRIINEPKRGIGKATVDTASLIAEEKNTSIFEILENSSEYTSLKRSTPLLQSFVNIIKELQEFTGKPSELIEAVFEKTGYKGSLLEAGEVLKPKIDSVEELISAAKEYEEKEGDNASLSGFLEEVSLVSDVDKYDEEADAVVLMTIHSAKGLEFPIVFLPGWEESLFPSMQAISEGDLDEERRLAYVAITRAKKSLYISKAKSRMLYGNTVYNSPSRFLMEIPPKYLESMSSTSFQGKPNPFGYHNPTYPHSQFGQGQMAAKAIPQTKSTFNASTAYREEKFFSKNEKKVEVATLELFNPGQRVTHTLFGNGTIVSSRKIGSDILYEVQFDSGETKKLMQTYAKLKKI